MTRIATANHITFRVDAVKPARKMLPEIPYQEAIAGLLPDDNYPLESWSQDTRTLVRPDHREAQIHRFLLACNMAYSDHRPLVLSPDMIWLLITQGLALHINANAEQLRHHFVKHAGKLLIDVRRDEFVKGFVGNDWEGTFTEFSAKIKEHIGEKTHRLIVREFSTTGPVETAAMEVVLMDAMQSYFVYSVTTSCGIPSITLEGTPEDWEQVREGAARLETYDLEWWIPHLLPVLDQFVQASRGNPNRDFWKEFYKLTGGSGGPFIHGYILNLFPYLGHNPFKIDEWLENLDIYLRNTPHWKYSEQEIAFRKAQALARLGDNPDDPEDLRRNPYIGKYDKGGMSFGIKTSDVSSLLSYVPFIWNYLETMHHMEFCAGFVGIAQDPETRALRPEIGWAVRERIA